METAAAVYLFVVLLMSLACFITYGFDKRQANNGGRRVPERTLHMMGFLGGWPGALVGRRRFRHKTRKVSFRVVFWLVVGLHICVVTVVVYALVRFQADAGAVR